MYIKIADESDNESANEMRNIEDFLSRDGAERIEEDGRRCTARSQDLNPSIRNGI